MSILFRYLLREYTKIFLMCLTGLMTVYLVVDFFEKVRRFVRHDPELGTILAYFAMKTPLISFQIAPLAVLMATLLTMGMFIRNHEIIAMRSCGISLYRIGGPFLSFAVVISLLLLGFSAVIIPWSSGQAEYIRSVLIEKKSNLAALKGDREWLQIGNQTLMNITWVHPDGDLLRGITLYRLGPDFQLTEITEAHLARYTEGGWVAESGLRRVFLPNGALTTEAFDRQPIALSQTPDDFSTRLSTEAEEMSLDELKSYAERLRRDGYSFTRVLTDYHGRIAFPFVCVVMVIVGTALSLRGSGSRAGGGLARGIGQALVIGFLYWMTHSVAIALGRSGRLATVIGPDPAALLAGWIANMIFLAFGAYLFLKVRQ